MLRPTGSDRERFRRTGAWRDETALDDLAQWRRETPRAPALTVHEETTGVVQLTYEQLGNQVERFAGALYELGVRPGQVVAAQIPNRWQVSVLLLACARLGAVTAPIMTTIRSRELERMLRRLDATVVVTVDRWAGVEHAGALAEMAERLPALRHRVVLGDLVKDDEVDFVDHFQRTPWERRLADVLSQLHTDPDRVVLVLFTSGTGGHPKAALHTLNTLHAGYRFVAADEDFGAEDVICIPGMLTHAVGIKYGVLMPLLVGASAVYMDTWTPGSGLSMLVETATTSIWSTPPHLRALMAELRRDSRPLPDLRHIVSTGTVITPSLVTEVAETFALPLSTTWGMTEVTGGTFTRHDDPVDRAAHSVGRPPARGGTRPSIDGADLGGSAGEAVRPGSHDVPGHGQPGQR
jgi:cyclohexanecarboxylate-CoA ligase